MIIFEVVNMFTNYGNSVDDWFNDEMILRQFAKAKNALKFMKAEKLKPHNGDIIIRVIELIE